MSIKTFMSTDWIEVHNENSIYKARVFLTDKDKAFMITIQDGKKRLFRVDADLLKFGEIGFFEKVMENAEELPIKRAVDIGLTGEL